MCYMKTTCIKRYAAHCTVGKVFKYQPIKRYTAHYAVGKVFKYQPIFSEFMTFRRRVVLFLGVVGKQIFLNKLEV